MHANLQIHAAEPRAPLILIVDDQADICQMFSMVLQPDGYDTECASSGKRAIASVKDHVPDLILLDVSMPDMDGYEVASTLKADPKTANIPIIMVSALVGRGARVIGLDSGAEDFLTKPVDAAELSLKIRNLLRLRKTTEPASAGPN